MAETLWELAQKFCRLSERLTNQVRDTEAVIWCDAAEQLEAWTRLMVEELEEEIRRKDDHDLEYSDGLRLVLKHLGVPEEGQ